MDCKELKVDGHDHLRPRLKLFLSADIVGSTALKQPIQNVKTVGGASAHWLSAIQTFFVEVFRNFAVGWNHESYGPAPVLWKTVGDEVIFWKELTDHRQLLSTLLLWKKVIIDVKQGLWGKKFEGLDAKCTAWMAGFPVRNKAILSRLQDAFSSDAEGGEEFNLGRVSVELEKVYGQEGSGALHSALDFIGPGIDTGFRISRFATSSRFVLSLDVVYMLLAGSNQAISDDDDLLVRFAGSENLKGVMGGRNYPIFYSLMPTAREGDDEESMVVSDHRKVLQFCVKFYAKHSEFIFKPFIKSESEQVFTEVPDDYGRQYDELVRADRRDRKKLPVPAEANVSADGSLPTSALHLIKLFVGAEPSRKRSSKPAAKSGRKGRPARGQKRK